MRNNPLVKLSFCDIFKRLHISEIKIPRIQRDYVQGIDSDRINSIRKNLIEGMVGAVKGGEPLDLNYIYGVVEEKKFIPLDGQQRLTTLFLFHWYIALKEKKLSNFSYKRTYEQRDSTREFCEKINDIGCEIKDIPEAPISHKIESNSKFYSEWINDPTVKGMLNTLCTIEKVINGSNNFNFEDAWKSLTGENAPISFFFLDLNSSFGVDKKIDPDKLFIKMNSRGLNLSAFENFKANLLDLKVDEQKCNDLEVLKDLAKKFDVDWLNYFWKKEYDNQKDNGASESKEFSIENVDGKMMRLFHAIIINEAISKLNINRKKENQSDSDKEKKYAEPLKEIEKLAKVKSDQIFYSIYGDKGIDLRAIFANIIRAFDAIVTFANSKEIKHLNDICVSEKLITNLINKELKPDAQDEYTYAERVLLYAFTKYLVSKSEPDEGSQRFELHYLGFPEWARFIRNLVQNREFNNFNDYVNGINWIDIFLNKLRGKAFSLDDVIKVRLKEEASGESDCYYVPTGFDESQIYEEIIKAKLIKSNGDWAKEIYSAEVDSFFRGQIRVMLTFAECNIEKFKTYRNILIDIFGDKGILREKDNGDDIKENKDNKITWCRAVLSKGIYFEDDRTDKNKKNIYSDHIADNRHSWRTMFEFVINKSSADKEISAEEDPCLKIDAADKLSFVKQTVDELKDKLEKLKELTESELKDNLKEELEKLAESLNETDDIRKYFTYTAFDKCNQGFIEMPSEKSLGGVLILKETRNCYRAELPMCYLYDKYFKNSQPPFEFIYTTGVKFPNEKDGTYVDRYSYLVHTFGDFQFYIVLNEVRENKPSWRFYKYKGTDLFNGGEVEFESCNIDEAFKNLDDDNLYFEFKEEEEEVSQIKETINGFCERVNQNSQTQDSAKL